MINNSRLTNKTLFCSRYSRNGFWNLTNFFDNILMNILIHNLSKSGTKNKVAIIQDKSSSKNSRPIISWLPSFSHNNRNSDSDKSRYRRNRITTMMPRIGCERRALCYFTFVDNIAIRSLFPTDNSSEDKKRIGSRELVRSHNVLNRLVGNDSSRDNEKKNDNKGNERFDSSVSVRMVFVSWFGCKFESKKNKKWRKDITCWFDSISDKGVRVSKISSCPFDSGKTGVPSNTKVPSLYRGFLVRDFCHLRSYKKIFPLFCWFLWKKQKKVIERFSFISFVSFY